MTGLAVGSRTVGRTATALSPLTDRAVMQPPSTLRTTAVAILLLALGFGAGWARAQRTVARRGLVNALDSVGEGLFGEAVFSTAVHPPDPIAAPAKECAETESINQVDRIVESVGVLVPRLRESHVGHDDRSGDRNLPKIGQ
jgi:hypothetical protein